jgi:hypothetical protein
MHIYDISSPTELQKYQQNTNLMEEGEDKGKYWEIYWRQKSNLA